MFVIQITKTSDSEVSYFNGDPHNTNSFNFAQDFSSAKDAYDAYTDPANSDVFKDIGIKYDFDEVGTKPISDKESDALNQEYAKDIDSRIYCSQYTSII